MAGTGKKLGQRLVDAGMITLEQLDKALLLQREKDGLLGELLVGMGAVSAQALLTFILTDRLSQLGEILMAEGLLRRSQLMMALEEQKTNGGRLGDICIRLGFFQREQLDHALKRHGKAWHRLGESLVEKGLITPEQLKDALAMQQRSGGKLGQILVYMGAIGQDALYRELATQMEMGRIGGVPPLESIAVLPFEMANRLHAVVCAETEASALVAVEERLSEAALAEIGNVVKKPVEQVLMSQEESHRFWETIYRDAQRHASVFGLYEEQAENSAIVTFSTGQLAALLVLGAALLVALAANWRATLIFLNIFLQVLYTVMTAIKFAIVLKGVRNNAQMRYGREAVEAIDEKELPVYTVLVPVYKEKEVVHKLMNNIGTLDYPPHKLDVRVLLEEGDEETIGVLRRMTLPSNYTLIVVPRSQPQTKPKACNYGLLHARGEYVVIYDAEDRPERDQLKKAYLAFQQLPEEFVCVQAKLNYFNSEQNLLTKLFTQEYSMWFELLLVGIMQMDVPIPLGGTSNHFKMSFLKKVGGWDPFNVTEDADLGIRLYKFRHKTAILDSRTWEEANSRVHNWIRQRSRWIKGYMQTWLVHMRRPIRFFKTVGLRGFIGYQAMILGTPLLPLVNPLFWGMMILWYATQASWIQAMFPGALYYIATVQFVLGNFAFTYMNVIGMYHVIRDCAMKGEQPFSYGQIKFALFTPLYWILMSLAAYKALVQLIARPFYWEKTDHGLTQAEAGGNGPTAPQAAGGRQGGDG